RMGTAQILALHLGRRKDRGTLHPTQISLAKWNNVRMALDVARAARELLGAGGITTEFQAMRHMLNLETVLTYEGTETVHQLVVGKELTGKSAF
ncbi:MAG TPA: acyl-CoA dehydrogenase family protein, partial [Gammaproteobacteria bacterium]|nr:acyl-CoA dehydrogenase family protein [Gammaproteobacteria bacterium]